MAPISGAVIHSSMGLVMSLLATVPHQTGANRVHMVCSMCIYRYVCLYIYVCTYPVYIMQKSLPSSAVRWLLDFSTFENYTVAAFIISLAFFFCN